MKVRKRDVVRALQEARRLALLTHNTASTEHTLRRHQWHDHQRQVQAQARLVERLTHDLGINETVNGGDDGTQT